MSLTLRHGATTQSLEAWGITDATIEHANLDVSRLSFAVPTTDIFAAPAFDYDDPISLFRDGVRIFAGRISALPAIGSAAQRQRYVVSNAWWDLTRLIYEQPYALPNTDFTALVGSWSTRVVLGQDNWGRRITSSQQIAAVSSFANILGTDLYVLAELDTTTHIPLETVRDISCAEAIRRMVAYTPDAVGWFDYTSTPPTLHITRRADLTAVELDFNNKDLIESFSLMPRHDLVPSGVRIIYQYPGTANDDPTDRSRPIEYRDVAGGSVVPGRPQISTIDTAGISAEALADTWLRLPSLGDSYYLWFNLDDAGGLPGVEGTGVEIAITTGDTAEELAALIAAAIDALAEFIAVDEGTVVTILSADAGALSGLTDEGSTGLALAVTQWGYNDTPAVTGPGVITATVELSTSGTETGSFIPVGLATQYYEALRGAPTGQPAIPPWEGSIALVERECSGQLLPGAKLNLANGRADWAAMGATVQLATEELQRGRTSVTLGVPVHLGLDSFVRYMARFRERPAAGSFPAQQHAGTTGTTEEVPGTNPTTNPEAPEAPPALPGNASPAPAIPGDPEDDDGKVPPDDREENDQAGVAPIFSYVRVTYCPPNSSTTRVARLLGLDEGPA